MPDTTRNPRVAGTLADDGLRLRASGRRLAVRAWAAAAVLLGLCQPAHAAENDAQLWIGSQLAAPITERFGFGLLVEERFRDDISELERVVVRPSLYLELLPRFVGTVGYDAHVIERPRSKLEQRIWQQLSYGRAWSSLAANVRLRLEERFFDDADAVGLRTRILLGLRVRLSRSFDLSAHNEFFVTLKDTSVGPSTGYDENRLFGGVGYRLGERLRLVTGYQMQFLERRGRDALNHTIILGFFVETPTLLGGD